MARQAKHLVQNANISLKVVIDKQSVICTLTNLLHERWPDESTVALDALEDTGSGPAALGDELSVLRMELERAKAKETDLLTEIYRLYSLRRPKCISGSISLSEDFDVKSMSTDTAASDEFFNHYRKRILTDSDGGSLFSDDIDVWSMSTESQQSSLVPDGECSTKCTGENPQDGNDKQAIPKETTQKPKGLVQYLKKLSARNRSTKASSASHVRLKWRKPASLPENVGGKDSILFFSTACVEWEHVWSEHSSSFMCRSTCTHSCARDTCVGTGVSAHDGTHGMASPLAYFHLAHSSTSSPDTTCVYSAGTRSPPGVPLAASPVKSTSCLHSTDDSPFETCRHYVSCVDCSSQNPPHIPLNLPSHLVKLVQREKLAFGVAVLNCGILTTHWQDCHVYIYDRERRGVGRLAVPHMKDPAWYGSLAVISSSPGSDKAVVALVSRDPRRLYILWLDVKHWSCVIIHKVELPYWPRSVVWDQHTQSLTITGGRFRGGAMHMYDSMGQHLSSVPLPQDKVSEPVFSLRVSQAQWIVADITSEKLLWINQDGMITNTYPSKADSPHISQPQAAVLHNNHILVGGKHGVYTLTSSGQYNCKQLYRYGFPRLDIRDNILYVADYSMKDSLPKPSVTIIDL